MMLAFVFQIEYMFLPLGFEGDYERRKHQTSFGRHIGS
jgi:hypothetical protein